MVLHNMNVIVKREYMEFWRGKKNQIIFSYQFAMHMISEQLVSNLRLDCAQDVSFREIPHEIEHP